MLRFMKEFIRGSMLQALLHLRLGCLSLDTLSLDTLSLDTWADPLFAASG